MAVYKKEPNPVEQEYYAFIKWLKSVYGTNAGYGFSLANFRQQPQYQWWTQQYDITPAVNPPVGPQYGPGAGPEVMAWAGRPPQGVDKTIMGLFGGGGLGTGGEEMSQVGPANINPTAQSYLNWMGQNYSQTGAYKGTPDTTGATTSPQGQQSLAKYRGMTAPGQGIVGVENIGGYNFTVMIDPTSGEPYFGESLGAVKATPEAIPGMTRQQADDSIAVQRWRGQQEEAAAERDRATIMAKTQAEIEARKQEQLALLAGEPVSWLQYSALAGQPPVVQPWMMPLMTQNQPTSGSIQPGGEDAQTFQYSIPQAQVGQPIPGYGPQGTQYQGGQYGGSATLNPYWSNPVQWPGQNYNPGQPDYSKLPQLQQPTEAYWQSMGPTQQQEYLGYERARTGAPTSQTLWGLPWNQALEAKERAFTAQTDADRAEAARKKAFAAWMPSGGMSLNYRR